MGYNVYKEEKKCIIITETYRKKVEAGKLVVCVITRAAQGRAYGKYQDGSNEWP